MAIDENDPKFGPVLKQINEKGKPAPQIPNRAVASKKLSSREAKLAAIKNRMKDKK
jgi:hypothetical protein